MSDDLSPPPTTGDLDVASMPATRNLVHKHRMRRMLAMVLAGSFAGQIVLAYIAFLMGKDIKEIKELLLEVIGPTSALLGSIIGFYFGSHDNSGP